MSTAVTRALAGLVAGFLVVVSVIVALDGLIVVLLMLDGDRTTPVLDITAAGLVAALSVMPMLVSAPLIGLAIGAVPEALRPYGGIVLGMVIAIGGVQWLHRGPGTVQEIPLWQHLVMASVEMAFVGAAVGLVQPKLERRIRRSR